MTLPKFLLAWSDFNWFCVYDRLRPAQNANWSIFRVLGLTALIGAVGASAGLVLGLGFFHQPVGWLPWLLGLQGSCVGLCWFGVTAPCWNQRAAQLRADPSLEPGLPKARHPFFRWCLGFVYFVILGCITPGALLVTAENLRGELAWKREYSRLAAAGEKLTFREVLGPEIAPEQNAGAAPIFAPMFDYHHSTASSPLVWSRSNEWARLENHFKLPSNYLPETSKQSNNSSNSPHLDLADWAQAYRNAVAQPRPDDTFWVSTLKLPPSGDPAQNVLAALSRADEELALICQAAALPRAQFPVHYDEAFEALLPHLAVIKSVQTTLRLRCAAHLARGDQTAAFADATNALNVAELMREEPLLISQLVRHAQAGIAASTVWQGLAEHRWDDAQLAFFQHRFARLDYLPGLVLAFEGERAGGIKGMERMIHEPHFYAGVMGLDSGAGRLFRTIPRGMLRQNQMAISRYETEMLANLRAELSHASEAGLTKRVQSKDDQLERFLSKPYSPFTVMIKMLVPATTRTVEKTARTQTAMQLASAACALERYRLAHAQYPERLEQLVPQFVTRIPLDPMVNQPFHYQRTDDGWFLLYSTGLNGKDDGGVMSSDNKQDKEEKDWPWPVPTRPAKVRLF